MYTLLLDEPRPTIRVRSYPLGIFIILIATGLFITVVVMDSINIKSINRSMIKTECRNINHYEVEVNTTIISEFLGRKSIIVPNTLKTYDDENMHINIWYLCRWSPCYNGNYKIFKYNKRGDMKIVKCSGNYNKELYYYKKSIYSEFILNSMMVYILTTFVAVSLILYEFDITL